MRNYGAGRYTSGAVVSTLVRAALSLVDAGALEATGERQGMSRRRLLESDARALTKWAPGAAGGWRSAIHAGRVATLTQPL